jgi:2-oxoglutarate dehydrogenase E2 component (dihydrolipoamide succinyltransferase)
VIVEVKVPQLSESVSEATLLDWHKREGEPVKRDENLIDIETDKVVLELPAPADGVLVRIMKQSKDSVGSGEVIAQIDTEAKAGAPAPAARKEPPPEKAKAAPPVMPAAQKIAAERGIDPSTVQGTGRDGRVTKGDVLQAKSVPSAPPAVSPPNAPLQQPPAPVNVEQLLTGRPEQRVPMSRLRRAEADRWIAGVCGGIARLTGVESWIWRLLFVLGLVFGGFTIFVYLVLWIFVPRENV